MRSRWTSEDTGDRPHLFEFRRRDRTAAVSSAILTLCVATAALASPATVHRIVAPPGSSVFYGYGVSGDGLVAVGRLTGSTERAFQWTAASGTTSLSSLTGYPDSTAYGANSDGSVIVGFAGTQSSSHRAVRWTPSGVEDLGVMSPGDSSLAIRASSDGNAIVGWTSGTQNTAFRWTQAGGMQPIGTSLFGHSYGRDISNDGATVVGYSGGIGSRAFRWTESGGDVELDNLPGAGSAYAYAVSGDGAYAFGNVSVGGALRAVRWDSNGQIEDLGTLAGGRYSYLMGANADGSLAVGWDNYLLEPIFWTRETGIMSLYDYLVSTGADLSGWTRQSFGQFAFDVSDDGATIVGSNFVVTGFAVVPVPGVGIAGFIPIGIVNLLRRRR